MDFQVKEDTVTPYFKELQRELQQEPRKEKVLKDTAQEMVDLVDVYVPKYNRNLMNSGHDEDFWKIKHEDGKSSLTVLYTGFTGAGNTPPEGIHVWWEFGRYHEGGTKDILDRDYAYYQETGIDKYAKSKIYRAKPFEGHHYLEYALYDTKDIAEYYAEQYLEYLLEL